MLSFVFLHVHTGTEMIKSWDLCPIRECQKRASHKHSWKPNGHSLTMPGFESMQWPALKLYAPQSTTVAISAGRTQHGATRLLLASAGRCLPGYLHRRSMSPTIRVSLLRVFSGHLLLPSINLCGTWCYCPFLGHDAFNDWKTSINEIREVSRPSKGCLQDDFS